MSKSAARSRAFVPYAWALAVCWLLPAVVVAVGYVLLPHDNAGGQCEGIGFGCTLPPAEGLLFLGFLAAPVLLGVGLVVCVVIAVVQHLRAR